ncbi:MAG: site-specific DNA-methyltransferase [Candidatus Eisenbacteria bacterium]|nr:site-specific DNA-methyltransferase [Candidatus Eisenbacteria bacterium]
MTERGQGWELHLGDSLEILRTLPAGSVDSCVTDPPYFLGAQPDTEAMLKAWLSGEEFRPGGRGFMGCSWDSTLPGPALWREVSRVLKPGAHVLAFGGSRTFDLLAVGLRLAGLEVRDTLSWLYGSGFPKSLNVSKSFTAAGDEEAGEWWSGFGTALKPAWEPVVLARKPLVGTVCENLKVHSCGALNLDAGRHSPEPWSKNTTGSRDLGGPEARNPALRFGMRITEKHSNEAGRFPANVILDAAAADQLGGASRFFYTAKASVTEREAGLEGHELKPAGGMEGRRDGSLGGEPVQRRNAHPTVKPLDLMEYLVRLVTPPGGIVLDPFTGSGSTGAAALRLGFCFVGVELSEEYHNTASARLRYFNAEGLFS